MALGSLAGAVGSRFVGGRVLLLVFALMTTAALLLMFIAPVEPGRAADGETMRFNRAEAIARSIEHVSLAAHPDFQDIFVDCMNFPRPIGSQP